MRRLLLALLAILLLCCGSASAARITSAVNPRVAHPLGRLLGAIPARGVALHPRRAAPRADAGPQPLAAAGTQAACPAGANQAPFALCWFRGSVLHANSVYTLFWAPPGLSFEPGYIDKVNRYFADQASASGTLGNVYSTDAQYYDSTGNAAYQSTLGGTAADSSGFPALSCVPPQLGYTCVSDADLTAELDRVIAARGWPRGLGPVYFVFLPRGASVCATQNGVPSCAYQVFCAYHSAYSSGGGPPTLYAAEPYAAVPGCDTRQSPNGGAADAVINTASHEHNEAITDPLGDGWLDLQGNENGDKCTSAYGPALGGTNGSLYNQAIAGGHYYLQEEFSNFSIQPGSPPDNGCAQSLPVRPPSADFTVATSPVITGQPASFVATVSDPDSTIASVSWDFGDGSAPGSGTNLTHTFTGTGPHTVVLSVIDALGLRTQATHVVQVLAPNPRAAFSVSPAAVRAGRAITFDGSPSSEPGGAIAAWVWSFGDGTQATGPVVRHTFSGSGPRNVTLVVADSAGASASTTQSIAVQRGLLISFGLVRGQSVRSALRRGLRVRAKCTQRCQVSASLTIGRAHARSRPRRGGVALVRLSRAARRVLRRRRTVTLGVVVAAGAERDAGVKTLRLRRR